MRRRLFLFVGMLMTVVDGRPLYPAESQDVFAANRALGRGVNLGNFMEAPRGASWGVRIEDSDFTRIKKAGFDSVRLPVKWSDYAQTAEPYAIEEGMFQQIDRLLDVAAANQLNVVLNIHHYDGLDEHPDQHTARFVAIWQQIAEHYRSRPSSVYFELHNEPHAKLESQWNDVLQQGVAAVRATNPDRPVIVGPIRWNSVTALDQLKLPSDEHLIVTVHYYHPFEFTHQGAEWSDARVRNIRDRKWEGKDAELALVRQEFDAVSHWAKQHGRPIFLGEFGAYQKAPLESRVKWTGTIAREAEARGFSWAYWEYAAGFGLFDRGQNAWREPLLQALIPPVPSLTRSEK